MTETERRTTPIELPGITDADRYQFAFKQLPQWRIERLKWPRRIFHGPLRYTGQIDRTEEALHIELHAGGGYDTTTKRFSTPWTLVIAAAALTPRQLANVLEEFEGVANTARENRLSPHVFALATQDPAAPHQLTVTDRAHVAFHAGHPAHRS
ncbi:hypothetical protein EEB19_22555 [Gordonia sp. OPL2]|nr:hypothetical protein EEB19_22555 [Gordonia sp. OPL2]